MPLLCSRRLGPFEICDERIEAFRKRWKVAEPAIFSSALRDDFTSDSDVDVLVSFAPDGAMTFERFIDMRQELSALFDGREVDLVEKRLVRNPRRWHEIRATRKGVYAA